ncbi:MAG: aldo/keto reductase [Alphaproteobacteria bacterium]|nr:aldo/keto reductase [Alphaproteobacteria bacterium]
MDYVKLSNSIEMPILGLGVYQINDLKECERVVFDALELGYRSIDTASAYCNETAVGRAIKNSGISHGDLFITTKIWIQDAGYETALNAFDISLKNLGLDYIDLYLIHQPFGDYYGSWRAMEKLYKYSLVRAIGVSNFYPDRLVDLISHNEITPMVNQIEINPFFQQFEAQKITKEHNIQMESWASFAEGRNNIFHDELLTKIGEKYGKTPAQVILRWLIQRGIVVIPKSVHKSRMAQNFDVFSFRLSDDDMAQIKMMDTGKSQFLSHTDYETAKWLTNIKFR